MLYPEALFPAMLQNKLQVGRAQAIVGTLPFAESDRDIRMPIWSFKMASTRRYKSIRVPRRVLVKKIWMNVHVDQRG
jgi:hypothetical protein